MRLSAWVSQSLDYENNGVAFPCVVSEHFVIVPTSDAGGVPVNGTCVVSLNEGNSGSGGSGTSCNRLG